ncbi:MAG: hypothetical protein AB7U59_16295 [Desulfovibrionaceae bacterium]|jgi:hypothetical protein
MRQLLFLVLLTLAVAAGCTRPPYTAPGKDLASLENDHTDCYTRAVLKVNTPPYPDHSLWDVDRECDACMAARGYQKHFRPF